MITIDKHEYGGKLMIDGKPFIMLGGELHNSSAASLDDIQDKFAAMRLLNINTLLVPLSWELIEPQEGHYDFSTLDCTIDAARARGMKVVFLWFGTMKNAISCYTPAWIKTDTKRFFRAQSIPGHSSWTVSPFCREAMECDARAFTAVMRQIREVDQDQQTVLMMQVENEPGILKARRDYCPQAEDAFRAPAPQELIGYLAEHKDNLAPELAEAWDRQGCLTGGDWTEIFGRDADEVFMAWYIASFVEHVAAAGRAEYDIPMYANAWLIMGPGYGPGDYPSGGPLAKVMDVWRAAAPTLDLIAPDIYSPEFRRHCAEYTRNGNPLFIPEAMNTPLAAATALYAIGKEAICFSPFAIDDISEGHPLEETYRLLADMVPVLTDAYGKRKLVGFLQQADEERFDADLGAYRFNARTNKKLAECSVPGAAILLSLSDDEFFCVGRNLTFTFQPKSADRTGELVWLDEGDFKEGKWLPLRRLNGDETAHGTGVMLRDKLSAVRFKLHSYS